MPDEVRVTADGITGGGARLTPAEVNALADERDDLVFFDGRNAVEAEVGRFRDAVVPPTRTTHDFVAALESGAYDHLKHRPVVTYCTGGIRCEVLTVLMRNRGFDEVYQLDGGIVGYGAQFGNDGLWQGSLAVFDNREVVDVGPRPQVIGRCHRCGAPTARLHNCADLACRERLVTCPDCAAAGEIWCADHGTR
ncbi:rhodanese-like domain-containing protein [Aestuariimicrobium soli]|uniref:rhodanese-like domain-containing protein n=1 Tax=Aestuariimicrobium soli TaxID=2035834 RepID=UPI003EBFDFF7